MSYRLSADHLTKREWYKQVYIVHDLVVSALTCLSVRGQMPPFAKVAAKTAPRRQSTSIEQSWKEYQFNVYIVLITNPSV